jgi:DNA repair protein RecO (recombination protein O)
MPTYTVHAVNVGSFALGETDKVLTIFSAERGIIRAVAKGARKPGSKIAGRADVLNVNKLMLASGRTFEIITQSENIETFPNVRKNLDRLSFCLYYAELTHHFGLGLADESESYFDFLCDSLRAQGKGEVDAAALCLIFELKLLEWLGYQPELDCCVVCRDALTEYRIAMFHFESGGIVCDRCSAQEQRAKVAEGGYSKARQTSYFTAKDSMHITPLVWKRLILAAGDALPTESNAAASPVITRATEAARRIMQSYIEYRAGKNMKSLELIGKL